METHTIPLVARERLDELYALYNHREFVSPDPLELLYDYRDLQDREIVGLIASSLAYGRVTQIVSGVSSILERMKPSPLSFLLNSSRKSLLSIFADFRYRFTSGEELGHMLWAARSVIRQYGSLYACFIAHLNEGENVLLTLSAFVRELNAFLPRGPKRTLLPSPDEGSACKRLNLFLRWMVRRDEVDPGGWSMVPLSKLIVPLDTHMHRICVLLRLTQRKQADMRTALDITQAFRRIVPEDPVRYDFALTRLGIRKDTDLEKFLRGCV